MEVETLCGLCKRMDEDGAHLFLKCKEVKKVWLELNLEEVRGQLLTAGSAREMMEKIFTLDPNIKMKVIMLLWLWWSERNKWREEGKRRTAVAIAYVTTAMSEQRKENGNREVLSDFRQKKSWSKPEPGTLKINVDGAFAESSKRGGWGFVIRDEQGAVILAGAGGKRSMMNPLHAELEACIAGIKQAVRLGLSEVILEADASMINTVLENDDYRLSAWGGLIAELRLLLMLEVSSYSIKIVPRHCNAVADCLAAYGSRSLDDEHVIWEYVPLFLEGLVVSDSAANE